MGVSEMARKGGKARAKKMTAEERRESARKAVQARWASVKAKGAKEAKEEMNDQQLYLAIGIPVFGIFIAMLTNIVVIIGQARGIEKRLDRIESRLTTIEQDYKMFFQDISRIKANIV